MRFKIEVLGDRAKVVLLLKKHAYQLALAWSESISNRIAATAGASDQSCAPAKKVSNLAFQGKDTHGMVNSNYKRLKGPIAPLSLKLLSDKRPDNELGRPTILDIDPQK